MTTVHFVYPYENRISCPDAIGYKVGKLLEDRYNVIHHWNAKEIIRPGRDDILLGHPLFRPWTVFCRSMKQKGWKKIISMFPFCPDNKTIAAFDPVVSKSDLFLSITGNYWYSATVDSLFSHWLPKMVHVDLALDRCDFPALKTKFNEKGKRKFVYIGNTSIQKNTEYLSKIAILLPEGQISWIGRGTNPIKGLTHLGYQDFRTESGKKCIAQHDFLITVGKMDANPITILEAMSWGLIPVATPQSGYVGFPGIVNVPLDDARLVVDIIKEIQVLPESTLKNLQEVNWQLLDNHFNWNRFACQVIDAIENDLKPALASAKFTQRMKMKTLSMYYRYIWRGYEY